MSTCSHKWSMTNVRYGYLVVEGCYRCKARCCFFSTEAQPPVDDYVDGEHFWTYRGSYQSAKFDLACDQCGERVDLDDLMGLMLSTCHDPACAVARTAREAGEGAWVYVALCGDSSHASGRCVNDRGIQALTEYFNGNLKDPDKRIIVVPCRECSDIDTCEGIVMADTGLTEFY